MQSTAETLRSSDRIFATFIFRHRMTCSDRVQINSVPRGRFGHLRSIGGLLDPRDIRSDEAPLGPGRGPLGPTQSLVVNVIVRELQRSTVRLSDRRHYRRSCWARNASEARNSLTAARDALIAAPLWPPKSFGAASM